MERSFARSKRYAFDRARWRGLWRMQIQDYLICAIQNIQVLIREAGKPRKWAAARASAVERSFTLALSSPLRAVFPDLCGPSRYYGYSFQRT